jgi:hypothetical protein
MRRTLLCGKEAMRVLPKVHRRLARATRARGGGQGGSPGRALSVAVALGRGRFRVGPGELRWINKNKNDSHYD